MEFVIVSLLFYLNMLYLPNEKNKISESFLFVVAVVVDNLIVVDVVSWYCAVRQIFSQFLHEIFSSIY